MKWRTDFFLENGKSLTTWGNYVKWRPDFFFRMEGRCRPGDTTTGVFVFPTEKSKSVLKSYPDRSSSALQMVTDGLFLRLARNAREVLLYPSTRGMPDLTCETLTQMFIFTYSFEMVGLNHNQSNVPLLCLWTNLLLNLLHRQQAVCKPSETRNNTMLTKIIAPVYRNDEIMLPWVHCCVSTDVLNQIPRTNQ